MDIHVVKSGDTLYSIALQHGVPMSQLILDNQLPEPDRLSCVAFTDKGLCTAFHSNRDRHENVLLCINQCLLYSRGGKKSSPR